MEYQTMEEAYEAGKIHGERLAHMKARGMPENTPYFENLKLEDIEAYSRGEHADLDIDSTVTPFQLPGETLVWKDTFWIKVFWVKGSSEGYYVHVEKLDMEKNSTTLMLGKVWNVTSAEKMVRDISRFVWEEWRN